MELHILDRGALDDLRTLTGGVAEQDVVIAGTVDLPGPSVGVDELAPVQQPLVVLPVEDSAAFDLEAVLSDFVSATPMGRWADQETTMGGATVQPKEEVDPSSEGSAS